MRVTLFCVHFTVEISTTWTARECDSSAFLLKPEQAVWNVQSDENDEPAKPEVCWLPATTTSPAESAAAAAARAAVCTKVQPSFVCGATHSNW